MALERRLDECSKAGTTLLDRRSQVQGQELTVRLERFVRIEEDGVRHRPPPRRGVVRPHRELTLMGAEQPMRQINESADIATDRSGAEPVEAAPHLAAEKALRPPLRGHRAERPHDGRADGDMGGVTVGGSVCEDHVGVVAGEHCPQLLDQVVEPGPANLAAFALEEGQAEPANRRGSARLGSADVDQAAVAIGRRPVAADDRVQRAPALEGGRDLRQRHELDVIRMCPHGHDGRGSAPTIAFTLAAHAASVAGRVVAERVVALATLIPMVTRPQPKLRIGEVSRRLGLSPELIRAWERRYGVVSPERTNGGTRCYSALDLERLRVMQREISMGMAPNEAALLALALHGSEPTQTPSPQDVAHLTSEFIAAARALDEPRAQDAIDGLLSGFTEDFVLREVFLPLYFDSVLGRAPSRQMSGAEERFVVNLLRGRLLGLARGWGEGGGPVALLACAPNEQNDLALICFGIALRGRGWRILFLGADTAVSSTRDVVRWLGPDFVLVAASGRRHFDAVVDELRVLGQEGPLAIVGRELTPSDAESVGAHLVRREPVAAATRLAEGRAP